MSCGLRRAIHRLNRIRVRPWWFRGPRQWRIPVRSIRLLPALRSALRNFASHAALLCVKSSGLLRLTLFKAVWIEPLRRTADDGRAR